MAEVETKQEIKAATEPETKAVAEPETKAATELGTKAANEQETKAATKPEALADSMVGELWVDVDIKASAEKFHHMFAKRPHHVSNVTPGHIGGVELHEGEWDKVGSIVLWNYIHEGKPKVAKDRIEAVDPEKNLIKFRVLEGDVMKEYKTFLLTLQVTPKQGGSGSVARWHMEYERIHDKVAHPETLLPFLESMSKEIDEHLLSTE
ncbi:unnamed protein product [Eruca vesicaria subsp. sativa]|uniref:Bet v I/Major latex protein domain-containing protein n=1 Tax=Eruca vesicaria subsp. sativa TaxID=29727 RepID=A0ABC8JTK6_ERUVS|nr:unnamed protein product [Eruca vesicaria subsp. sativa]